MGRRHIALVCALASLTLAVGTWCADVHQKAASAISAGSCGTLEHAWALREEGRPGEGLAALLDAAAVNYTASSQNDTVALLRLLPGRKADADAMFEAAVWAEEGAGSDGAPDLAISLLLFRAASDFGHPRAQAEIAMRLALGMPVPVPAGPSAWALPAYPPPVSFTSAPDVPSALVLYVFAAAAGDPMANLALAHRHSTGGGVPVSCRASIAHYRAGLASLLSDAFPGLCLDCRPGPGLGPGGLAWGWVGAPGDGEASEADRGAETTDGGGAGGVVRDWRRRLGGFFSKAHRCSTGARLVARRGDGSVDGAGGSSFVLHGQRPEGRELYVMSVPVLEPQHVGVRGSTWRWFDQAKGDKSEIRDIVELLQSAADDSDIGKGINFILGSVLSRSRDRGLRDTDRAREHFTVAALAGDVGAMAQLGQMYAGVARTRGEWEEASKWLRLAAEGKDAAGLFGVGAMLLRGLYPEAKDPESAFRFLQQAAESGHADAHFLIGAMLMAGLGVERSPVRAAQAWAEAASKGHLAALWNLAALQVQGELAPEGGKQGYTVSVKNDLLFPAGGSGARRFGSAKEAGTCAVAARLLGMVAQGGPWVAVVEAASADAMAGRLPQAVLKYLRASEWLGLGAAAESAAVVLRSRQWAQRLESGGTLGLAATVAADLSHAWAFLVGLVTGSGAPRPNLRVVGLRVTTAAAADALDARAAAQGSYGAMLSLGLSVGGKKPALAATLLRHASATAAPAAVRARAAYHLAFMHQFAIGLPGDLHLAERLLDYSLTAEPGGWLAVGLSVTVLMLQRATCWVGDPTTWLGWAASLAAWPTRAALSWAGAEWVVEWVSAHWLAPAAVVCGTGGSVLDYVPRVLRGPGGASSGSAAGPRRVGGPAAGLDGQGVLAGLLAGVRGVHRPAPALNAEFRARLEAALAKDPELQRFVLQLGAMIVGLGICVWMFVVVLAVRSLRRRLVARVAAARAAQRAAEGDSGGAQGEAQAQ